MAVIEPLCGIRYDAFRLPRADVSSLIAPPYDILDERDRDGLLARSERNIVAIDLPHMPPNSAGPDELYDQAARLLKDWLDDGTLIRDDRPTIYVYHQRYQYGGRRYVRRMFLARLRLEQFRTGRVFPHEQTFPGPKQDRLKLTEATQCNVSPVFALYPDRDNSVAEVLNPGDRGPDLAGTLDEVENLLWLQTDERAIRRVQSLMADKNVYIADGHHRYETGLMYRDWLLAQQPRLPDAHPGNFILVAFCGMEDPGLLILPTHRVLVGVPAEVDLRSVLERAGSSLSVERTRPASPARISPARRSEEPAAYSFVVYDGRSDEQFALHVNSRELLDPLEPARSAAWRRLNVVVLHRYVIAEVLGPAWGAATPTIQYVKDAQAARRLARAESGVVFELEPIRMEQLRDVCEGGDVMPQKSTYFYPKLATGMVISPVA